MLPVTLMADDGDTRIAPSTPKVMDVLSTASCPSAATTRPLTPIGGPLMLDVPAMTRRPEDNSHAPSDPPASRITPSPSRLTATLVTEKLSFRFPIVITPERVADSDDIPGQLPSQV